MLVNDLIVTPFVLLAGKADAALNNTGAEGLPKSHAALLALVMVIIAAAALAAPWFRKVLSDREVIACAVFVLMMVAGPLIIQLMNGSLLSGRFYIWAGPGFLLIGAAIVAAAPRRLGQFLGIAALVVMLGISIWEIGFANNGDADWRSLMGTISERQAPGDILVSFPLHNGAIAADYYLPKQLPIKGGFPAIGSDSIYFLPAGGVWGGYKSGYWAGSGADPALSGPQLELRFGSDLKGAQRLWLISDDSLFTQYPGIKRVLDEGWTASGHWDYPPFTLTLYEPRGD